MTGLELPHPEDFNGLSHVQKTLVVEAIMRIRSEPKTGNFVSVAKEHQLKHHMDLSGLFTYLVTHPTKLTYQESVSIIYDWDRQRDLVTIIAIGPRMASKAHNLAQERISGKPKLKYRPMRHHNPQAGKSTTRRTPDFREGSGGG